jgi:hypothetical protein
MYRGSIVAPDGYVIHPKPTRHNAIPYPTWVPLTDAEFANLCESTWAWKHWVAKGIDPRTMRNNVIRPVWWYDIEAHTPASPELMVQIEPLARRALELQKAGFANLQATMAERPPESFDMAKFLADVQASVQQQTQEFTAAENLRNLLALGVGHPQLEPFQPDPHPVEADVPPTQEPAPAVQVPVQVSTPEPTPEPAPDEPRKLSKAERLRKLHVVTEERRLQAKQAPPKAPESADEVAQTILKLLRELKVQVNVLQSNILKLQADVDDLQTDLGTRMDHLRTRVGTWEAEMKRLVTSVTTPVEPPVEPDPFPVPPPPASRTAAVPKPTKPAPKPTPTERPKNSQHYMALLAATPTGERSLYGLIDQFIREVYPDRSRARHAQIRYEVMRFLDGNPGGDRDGVHSYWTYKSWLALKYPDLAATADQSEPAPEPPIKVLVALWSLSGYNKAQTLRWSTRTFKELRETMPLDQWNKSPHVRALKAYANYPRGNNDKRPIIPWSMRAFHPATISHELLAKSIVRAERDHEKAVMAKAIEQARAERAARGGK